MAALDGLTPAIIGAANAAGGSHQVDRSLRFNDPDGSYLSNTISGNITTFTYSFWVKRCVSGNRDEILDTPSSTGFYLYFDNNGFIKINDNTQNIFTSNGQHRDPSAWMHVVVNNNGTTFNLYVNGVLDKAATITTQLYSGAIEIGSDHATDAPDYYLAEIHLVDGQALSPTDFGAYDDDNIWNPKEYSGSYGTNGAYLKFADNSSNAALGTDSSGNNNTWTVNNFSADGGEVTVADATDALPILNTTGNQGENVGSGTRSDSDGSSIVVAVPLNGSNGGTTITDYHQDIKGSGSAKTISIYTGTAGGATTSTVNSRYYGSSFYVVRGATNDYTASSYLYRTGDTDFDFGTGDFCVEFWYYPQNMVTNSVIFDNRHPTTNWPSSSNGFSLVHNAGGTIFSYSGGSQIIAHSNKLTANKWHHIAYTRDSGTERLFVNGDFFSNPASSSRNYNEGRFHLGSAANNGEGSSGYYQDFRMYKGTPKYTSNFTPPAFGDGPAIDSLIDSPTNYEADSGNNGGNYPTWNPLDNGGSLVLSNGNLEAEDTNNDSHRACRATQRIPNSDKFYFECTITAFSNTFAFGISTSTAVDPELATSGSRYLLVNTGGNVQRYDGSSYTEFSGQSGLGSGASLDSVLQVAVDQDAGKLWFGLNNVWLGTTTAAAGDPSNGTNPTLTGTYTDAFPVINCVNTAGAVNFGQREFKYTIPTNFKSLCTQNSPDPSIADGSTGMNSTLYTGDGSARNISTPYGPDFVWIKGRSGGYDHGLFDVIRGANQRISSNSNGSEGTEANSVTAFNSDSFSLGTLAFYNNPSTTFVAWNWDAGTSNSTISAGSLNDSSTYNQSQVWSNFYSSTSGFEQNSAGNAFDPNTDNVAASYSYGDTQSLVLSTGVTYTSQIRAKTHYTSGTAYINGDSGSAVSVGSGWITVKTGSGTMNRIDFTSSGARCYVSAIEVDGKILIDPIPAITSTVRANPSYGFSIVKYTGDGKNTANVGHGLNAAPELVLCKDLEDTDNWQVYHANAQTSGAQLLKLNNTDAVVANNGAWNNQTPTSSIVITGGGGTNDSGNDHIMYCFAPVAGYSAFGSYEGSGSTDGPFVFTGFTPRWIMIKNIDNYGTGYDWFMFDTARDTHNVAEKILKSNTGDAESTSDSLDILSNGFKLRANTNGINLNAHTHIWAAFAEHPFKNTRAR